MSPCDTIENECGIPIYNWQYLDSLFDFLLGVNIRPFLELSFTPSDLRTAGSNRLLVEGQHHSTEEL
jgi:beta-xylosidase